VANESGHDEYPRVYAFETFFYMKLTRDGATHGSWSRFMSKIDFFNYHLVLIPIHLENHWTLAVGSLILFESSSLHSYSSFLLDN